MSGFALARPAAAAGPAAAVDRTDVTVVEISGLLDRIQARFLGSIVSDKARSDVVIVRLDSGGVVAKPAEMNDLISGIEHAPVPVAVWVGPGRGAQAKGGAERILRAADVVGAVPGAAISGVLPDVRSPTLGDFIVALDQRGGISVPTEVVRRNGRPPQRELATSVRVSFAEPSFGQQMLHAVSTPTAAYMLLTAGLLLLVFEFFTGGIGVAGAVAVICLIFGGFGLGALPTRPLGLVLVAFGIVGYAIDVQVGVPRVWTVIGTIAFTAGSFFLFAGHRVPWLVLVAVVAAVILFMVAGMPAVVRTRFSTPTIGRQSMIGETGTAATAVAPDGVVTVRGAPWKARTNRATPIPEGATVKVASIDGLLLEVEPIEGAAQDYRERAVQRKSPGQG